MKLSPLVFLAITLVACQSPTTDASQEPLRGEPASAHSDEPDHVGSSGVDHLPEPEIEARTIHLSSADCSEAEDGRGNLIQPTDCVRLTARANTWPARALDPVLHIGQLRFHQYTYGEPGELIFFTDRALLPASSAAAIHYGDDPNERYELRNRLEVAR